MSFWKNNTVVNKDGEIVNENFILPTTDKHSCLWMLFGDEKSCDEGNFILNY